MRAISQIGKKVVNFFCLRWVHNVIKYDQYDLKKTYGFLLMHAFINTCDGLLLLLVKHPSVHQLLNEKSHYLPIWFIPPIWNYVLTFVVVTVTVLIQQL